MHLRELKINKELGRKEGMATDYGNLGNVYMTREELDRAEEMYLKTLEIDTGLGRKEGLAITYANRGLIAEERGDSVKARDLWTKSRDLYDEIGIPHEVKRAQGLLDGLENGLDGDRDDGA